MGCEWESICPSKDGEDPRLARELTRRSYALVLAGGRGSRLMQLTEQRSKPAVPFGGKFRIIDFTLSNCINSGVRRIGVATQYKAQSLIRHIQRGWSFLDGRFDEFIDIIPAQQQTGDEHWYQGTADAVFQNRDMILRNEPEYVLVLSGDHIYKMDYGRMLAQHARKNADVSVACLAVPLEQAKDFGVMGVDAGQRVVEFLEKPERPQPLPGQPKLALASMGIYVFTAQFLYEQLERDAADSSSSHDFGKDIIPYCVGRHNVYAHSFADSVVGGLESGVYWRDVGTLDAFWEANLDLAKVTPKLNLYDESWPVWTYQEQLPPAKFVFDDDGRRGMAVDSLVCGGDIISGAVVRRSLLFSRVRINSYSLVEDSVILPAVEIGRNCIIRRAIIDKRCSIPDGMEIGVDRAEDARRFHVTENGITLVTPAMLGQRMRNVR
ncbi:MAG: glucose-1-phosphate adenylyltransferase [Rhodocyclaceae bacterium]|nr:glucose-1-phosphate adenylyltransferase [Rhodocyclaceae bacterium]MBX3667841.1 glucose-1-phosphate adenylyltransferase [Rhodocyclaceae bacterium]